MEKNTGHSYFYRAKDRCKALFDQTAVGVMKIETEAGCVMMVNRRFCEIAGFLPEEIIGMPFRKFVLSESQFDPICDRLISKEIDGLKEKLKFVRKDGAIIWVELTFLPLWQPDETPHYHVFIVEDITARKSLEQALEERVNELSILNQISRELNTSLSLEDTVNIGLRGIHYLIQPDFSFLFFREGDRLVLKGTLPAEAEVWLKDSMPAQKENASWHRVGECLCGQVFTQEKAIFSTDITRDPLCTREECKKSGVKSFVALPLKTSETIFGVIGLASKTFRDFEAQENFLQTLTHHVAISIVNARLFESAQEEIMERKRAETYLKTSEKRFFRALDNMPVLVWIYDAKGKVTYLNKVTEKLTGLTLKDIAGRREEELFSQAIYKKYSPYLNDTLNMGTPHTFEMDLPMPEMETLNIVCSFIPLFDGEGKVQEVLAVAQDLTAHRKLEYNLKLTQFAINNASFGCHWVRSDGSITYVNDYFCHSLGYSREELLKMSVGDIDPQERPDEWLKTWQNIKTNKVATSRTNLRRKDGTQFPVEITANYMEFDGKEYGSAYVRDITYQKHAEEERERLRNQLYQSQKIDAIGQLAGGIAHDFNNMLQAILGYTEMGVRLTDAESRVHNFFTEIRKAAKRSTELTRQLLTFARKQTISPQVMDMNEAISGLVKMIQRLIGEHIELIWKPSPDIWPVKMDPVQVDQILINISANARDAISGPGILSIQTCNMVFDDVYCQKNSGFIPGEYVGIFISDNGCGMEEGLINHIFEPFFTTKAQGKGTGLGLSTVHGIVKQNMGFINIYSELGRGTTFRIYLPRTEANIVSETVQISSASIQGSETILIVEDDLSILRIGTEILESNGYKVLTAQKPGQAITMLSEENISADLLITDVVMPEMNGKELHQEIKALLPNIKTIYMSGYPSNIIAHHGMLETDINFIHKPFSMYEFTKKVRQVLDEDMNAG